MGSALLPEGLRGLLHVSHTLVSTHYSLSFYNSKGIVRIQNHLRIPQKITEW